MVFLLTVKMAQHHLHHLTFLASPPPPPPPPPLAVKAQGVTLCECYSVCYRFLVRAAAFRTTAGRLALESPGSAIDSVA